MALSVARIWGDPLVDDAQGRALRKFIDLAFVEGVRLELCWSGVRGASRGLAVEISDGNGGQHRMHADLLERDLSRLLRRTSETVPATSPLLVFGDGDAVLMASLEYPDACVMIQDEGRDPNQLLELLLDFLATVRVEGAEFALLPEVFEQCLSLPPPAPEDRGILHYAGKGDDAGSQVLLRCLHNRVGPVHLRLVFTGASPRIADWWRRELSDIPNLSWEVLDESVNPAHFVGCLALVQPDARFTNWQRWAMAMAAQRVLVAGRHADNARLIRAPGVCLALGGRHVGGEFRVDPRCLDHALNSLLDENAGARAEMQGIASRARSWARMHFDAAQPAARKAPRVIGRRPLVVLEAPMFERSSTSILTLETALALQRADKVELRLCPVVPFKEDLQVFAERFPSLVSCLSRPPATADLWIRSGWPILPHRPDAKCFAVRIDWEYGSLPTELTPLLTEEADRVIVHSRVVQRAVLAAGSSPRRILRIPHGVDAQTFHPEAPVLDRVISFKGGRSAVLYVGELIWRKGFDLWIKTMLAVARAGLPVCGVIKTPGGDSKYRGFEMRGLIDRCIEKAPFLKILTIEEDLSAEQMAGLYRACDLLFHPYRGEGFCMPVLEAGACGLPVLATAGGSTDDFHDSSHGLPAVRRYVDLPGPHEGRPYVLEPDAEECVEILIDHVGRLSALRAQSRASAETLRARHTWDRAAAQIEQLAFDASGIIPRNRRRQPKSPMMRESQGIGCK